MSQTRRLEAFMVSVDSNEKDDLMKRVTIIENYLGTIPDNSDLKDLCYTATVATVQFDNRVVFLCRSITDLKDSISKYLHQDPVSIATDKLASLNCMYLAILAVYESYGVHPSLALPYCSGYNVALYISGMVSLEGSLKTTVSLAYNFARSLYGTGSIFIAQIGKDKMEKIIESLSLEKEVFIPESSTSVHCLISGTIGGCAKLCKVLDQNKIKYVNNKQAIPWHCPLAEIVREESYLCFDQTVMPAKLPIYGSGEILDETNYKTRPFWGKLLSEPIQVNDGIKLMMEREPDCNAFLEIAPIPLLGSILRRNLFEKGMPNHLVVPTMVSHYENNFDTLICTLAKLSVGGHPVKWDVVYPHDKNNLISNYPINQ
eukprot:gene11630-13580_t